MGLREYKPVPGARHRLRFGFEPTGKPDGPEREAVLILMRE